MLAFDDGSGESKGATIDAVLDDPEAAIAWFDSQFFAVIDQLRPWIVGESDGFRVDVQFDAYPALASALSVPLNRSPATLLSEGFILTDADLREAIADDFGGGIAAVALRLMLIAIAMLAVAITWRVTHRDDEFERIAAAFEPTPGVGDGEDPQEPPSGTR